MREDRARTPGTDAQRQEASGGSGATWLAVMGTVCVLAGCSRPDAETSEGPDKGIHKTYERGPATFNITTDRATLTIAERLTLTLEVVTDEPYEVELPGFGEKLEQFGIVDYETIQPELTDEGKIRRGRTYILDPFLSGEYRIPPMKVYFWKRNAEPERTHELESDELLITVTSLLPESVADLTIHDIAGPVTLPRSRKPIVLGSLLVLLLLAGAVTALVLIRRRQPGGSVSALPRITPQEAAYRELEALIAEDLIKRGLIKPFYRRVSDILRRYIERRFGLHAPEQTTEEFLGDLGANNILKPDHKTLLQRFLHHCDLVKFAEHQPSTSDIQNTFDSCKEFITQTEPAPS